ncbi:ecdysone 20-monooxygenase isoform X1 [Trichogramma pretiosum]|uniref:ecdysone 20-monooxygenase isoform X1 n=1 Tax=Trichogramma pretiosum TaxID=7493 RepID=UPI0006C97DC9|nr:ecdysone 20-monooxygenase isoform X1 [Trichogramma pretiosum]XP_014226675.1 ecdysone 20-monooxygenase isoform X1 [Trichogramma pretiosum]XP_014226676.1 ecdysone 20-monooxygenase isoform X1 [Trichogramma pretiosum]XP_014226677.1 ecdysone 20-monooxygenase isoform X1 [Trichogramma pretiosum]XP_014226679.1 ecdysone 20-monooxygenase isoform X1 [Trichogramma pretiosum]
MMTQEENTSRPMEQESEWKIRLLDLQMIGCLVTMAVFTNGWANKILITTLAVIHGFITVYFLEIFTKDRNSNENPDTQSDTNTDRNSGTSPDVNYDQVKTIDEIPGPLALPFIGTNWIFYRGVGYYEVDRNHEAYHDLSIRYGQIVRQESYWNYKIISVFNGKDIETIMKLNTKYPLRPPQDIISHYRLSRKDRYTNSGLVNEQGLEWEKLRNSLTPGLMSSLTINGFFSSLNTVTDDFVELIKHRRNENDTVVSFEEIACRFGLESTCMLVLGRRMNFLKTDSTSELTQKLAKAVRTHFLATRDAAYGLPTWKYYANAAYKNLIQSEETIYDIISDLINQTIEENKDVAQDEAVEAVFQSILREKTLDNRDKKAAIVDFIAAGIHTIGNTLCFLLHKMGKHTEVQRQIHEEAQQLAPQRCEVPIKEMRNAKYIKAFIQEVYRLTPTAPDIARILDQSATLSNHELPAGTVVLLHTWLAGLNEENFVHARQLIPERWLENSSYQPHSPHLVAPFGYGRRICPGKRFVDQALQLAIAKISRAFVVSAEDELVLKSEYIMAPQGPVRISFRDIPET